MTHKTLDDWLQNKHGNMITPQQVIAEYVQKAVHDELANQKRLIIGQDNEVYDVTTSKGRKLIVRISHKEDPRFEGERWALDAARQAGVPTPEVFLVEKAELQNKTVTFCIEEKLPGVPLDLALKGKRPEGAIKQIGELLSKLHSVKVDGFGYLQPDGKGWDIPFSKIMLDLVERADKLHEAALRYEVNVTDIDKCLSLIEQHSGLYDYSAPVLTHGDIGPDHILVDNDQITGIIDMQECSGNHPIFDLVKWNNHAGRQIPLSKVVASYGNKSLFDETYEPLFHLVTMRHSLWMLMVRVEQDNPFDVDDFKRGIAEGLRFFSNGR